MIKNSRQHVRETMEPNSLVFLVAMGPYSFRDSMDDTVS